MEELKEVSIRRSIATADNVLPKDRYFKISGLISLYTAIEPDKKKYKHKNKHKATIK